MEIPNITVDPLGNQFIISLSKSLIPVYIFVPVFLTTLNGLGLILLISLKILSDWYSTFSNNTF